MQMKIAWNWDKKEKNKKKSYQLEGFMFIHANKPAILNRGLFLTVLTDTFFVLFPPKKNRLIKFLLILSEILAISIGKFAAHKIPVERTNEEI